MLASRDCANVRLFKHRGRRTGRNRFPHIAEAFGMRPDKVVHDEDEVVGCDPDGISEWTGRRGCVHCLRLERSTAYFFFVFVFLFFLFFFF